MKKATKWIIGILVVVALIAAYVVLYMQHARTGDQQGLEATEPTVAPTAAPTVAPTAQPTPAPSEKPQQSIVPMPMPTVTPLPEPMPMPTVTPLPEPMPMPTVAPLPDGTMRPSPKTPAPSSAQRPQPREEAAATPEPSQTAAPAQTPEPSQTAAPAIAAQSAGEGKVFDLAAGGITIREDDVQQGSERTPLASLDGGIVITGRGSEPIVIDAEGVVVQLTLRNATIEMRGEGTPLAIESDARITLEGYNRLVTGEGAAIANTGTLSIHGPGSLSAQSLRGPGMNGGFALTGGEVTLQGGGTAAGLDLTADNNMTALLVTGGTLNAYGAVGGAGIGSDAGEVGNADNRGDVLIQGGIVNAQGGEKAAGIGGGAGGSGARVVLQGGVLTARGGKGAAGIGGGEGGSGGETFITGGTCTVSGGLNAAAIGGGAAAEATDIHVVGHGGSTTIAGGALSVQLNSATEDQPLGNDQIGAFGAGVGEDGKRGAGGSVYVTGGMVSYQGAVGNADLQSTLMRVALTLNGSENQPLHGAQVALSGYLPVETGADGNVGFFVGRAFNLTARVSAPGHEEQSVKLNARANIQRTIKLKAEQPQ